MAQYKGLNWLLRDKSLDDSSNLHRIAIASLQDSNRVLERWWTKKYQRPLKDWEDHVSEELVIEMLEDFYEAQPAEVHKFLLTEDAKQSGEWDGRVSPEHEDRMKKVWSKKKQVDISKYQSKDELTPEQEEEILANLGRGLPGSRVVTKKGNEVTLGKDDEFEEKFDTLG
jgi:hypothetical protein